MYLDFLVDVPPVRNKIIFRNIKGTDYVYYEYDRVYDPDTQKTDPKRTSIGKLSKEDPRLMQPNDKFLQFFPETDLPEERNRSVRSSCLRIGCYIVIRKIVEDYGLAEILGNYFSEKDVGLFLDLAAYTIVTENNAGQYYPDYAYNHPLFTLDMKVYSDSKVSDFFHSMSEEQSVEFLNEWNSDRDHREKIYISYDSTNKNSQAGDVEFVEYGHPKVDVGLPVFNYAIAYDTDNKEPLFYEKYPGSINDVSQLEYVLDRAYGYGYRHIGFILDRGYFSKPNIESLDAKGYSFVIMVKGKADLVNGLVSERMGSFEKKRMHYIDAYDVYGITVRRHLYATDKEERFFHIYHSVQKESAERTALEKKIRQMKNLMDKNVGNRKQFGSGFEHYFILHYNEKTGQFLFYEERTRVIEEELEHCGYFSIITSEKMKASEALELYKSRDSSEKLFRGDKSYLGNKSERTYGSEATDGKIFVEFVALIVRNRIYNCLKDKMKSMDKRPNYMTVPAALRELEKIEMVRLTDTKYHLDHAVTSVQKDILDAFGLDVQSVKLQASEISKELSKKRRA